MKAQAPSAPAPIVAKDMSKASTLAAQASSVNSSQLDAEHSAATLLQQKNAMNAQSVLFDFDDYTVKPSYTDMLQQQATFLKSQQTDRLMLQGNSDERGGAEYNLALGQKRADAVRKALLMLGAPEERIETISFGKEKPKATCSDESCWSQNRRADFAHSNKQ